jgi:Zn-dependent peptidase ImmA (M78 family)/DNA-binding XRE family transcriptional regulator
VSSDRIAVVPAVIQWARQSAGLPSDQAAKRLGISETSLASWETGGLEPTIKQLRKAAKVYRRPLAVLLLPTPPEDFQPLKDFRKTTRGDGDRPWSPALHAEFKRALSQREVFLELIEIAPGSIHQPDVNVAIESSQDADEAGRLLRAALRLDEEPPNWSNSNDALNVCVTAVERLGILVIQTHGVAMSEMHGFSISEWPCPVVALNGSDWPRRRVFTLLHELTHIAFNAGGLCDLHDSRPSRRTTNDEFEHFCNLAAAAALMPRDAFLADAAVRTVSDAYEWTLNDLSQLSRRYGASSEAVLLRLVTVGKATWDLYWRRKAELETQYEQLRRQEQERRRDSEGGPSYYVVKARDLGHAYVASVLDAYQTRAISSLDVADYLDVRYDQLPQLEAVLR